MNPANYGWFCDGCGKRVMGTEVPEDAECPPGWFMSREEHDAFQLRARIDRGPWSGCVVACSSTCIPTAKENVKQRAQEAVERFKRRVDDTVMEQK